MCAMPSLQQPLIVWPSSRLPFLSLPASLRHMGERLDVWRRKRVRFSEASGCRSRRRGGGGKTARRRLPSEMASDCNLEPQLSWISPSDWPTWLSPIARTLGRTQQSECWFLLAFVPHLTRLSSNLIFNLRAGWLSKLVASGWGWFHLLAIFLDIKNLWTHGTFVSEFHCSVFSIIFVL